MSRKQVQLTVSESIIDACIEALRYKAKDEAAQSQGTSRFDAEDTVEWQHADRLERAKTEARPRVFTERSDVEAFQRKFGVPMPATPHFLNDEAFQFRLKFLREELDEFERDHLAGDMHGAADALVDLAYVLHGTVLMMGLPWGPLWNEVQRANMAKVRATSAAQSKRGSALDVVKPEGWVPPDHTAALGKHAKGGWPITLQNQLNMVFTSGAKDPLELVAGDRRFLPVEES